MYPSAAESEARREQIGAKKRKQLEKDKQVLERANKARAEYVHHHKRLR